MVRTWIACVLCLCIGASVCAHTQQVVHSRHQRPTVFAPEENNLGFEDAKLPSDAVLDSLLQTKEAKEEDRLVSYDRESLRKLFTVVRVDLSKANDENYIVMGSPPMSGADNIWFWIVQVKQGKGTVLLFMPALSFTILGTQTNGYRNLREVWGGNIGTDIRVFRYNGTFYKLAHERFEKAKP